MLNWNFFESSSNYWLLFATTLGVIVADTGALSLEFRYADAENSKWLLPDNTAPAEVSLIVWERMKFV